MKFQQKPHKKTKDKKSFIEKIREEEQKKMDRLIKTNDKENEDGTKRVDRETEIWKKKELDGI
jgi:hypothetical protein